MSVCTISRPLWPCGHFEAAPTTTASAQASETARVDALTGICSSAAGRMATARSTDLAALKGYDNRAKRDELVAVIMADIQVPADILDKISTSCSRSLS
ncbi:MULTISPECIES: hypothetical protein [Sinorhizobium]|uniref:hypothetical protein n=1 Tax=Sinorhizobium TaxID=28105 RepID=UPI001F442DDD|nr:MULTISPECIES: hypothetical protein [Sinorhizobium]WQO48635.1 hypothetical protein U8C42_28240 [Sinorhizobium medicae]